MGKFNYALGAIIRGKLPEPYTFLFGSGSRVGFLDGGIEGSSTFRVVIIATVFLVVTVVVGCWPPDVEGCTATVVVWIVVVTGMFVA